MSDSQLRKFGAKPINLEPLYYGLLDELGDGHEEMAKRLTVVAVEVIEETLRRQKNCTAMAQVHRSYVAGCLANSLVEWEEWGIPEVE